MAVETMAASDLASLLVEESLGFAGGPAKLDALRRIEHSLRSCTVDGEGGDNDDAEALRLRHEWRAFLEGASDGPDVLLRDTFVNCLVECCRPGEDEGEEDEDVIFDVIEVALLCLSRLVCLRCVEADASGKKKKRSLSVPPIFGHDFLTNIAADVVQALRLDDGSSASAPQEGVSHAASELIIALLRADRPRNEMCTPTVRDMILLPASAPEAAPEGSVACVAEAVCASVLAGVEAAVPGQEGMDEVELQMRRETAALSQLQDVKDVMMHVGMVCSQGLGPEGGESPCSRRILAALQGMYDIGAFAVESQLETLLDEKAAPILSRLDKESMADQMVGAPTDAMEMDDDEDGDEADADEANALAPLYAHMARPPIILTTVKNLDSMLVAITESLSATDAELWDERLNALFDLECILAGGVASMGHDARHLFVERLRKMPLGEQFTDLRSQITQQACRVIVATAFEFRDYVAEDSQLNQAMSLFVERCLPSILDLCKSGTRLMAAQGMNCLLSLSCVCGEGGIARLVPRFCDEILGKKVHKNRKRGSVMALTGALRVWDATCFVKYLDELTNAVKEAATNRDPAVREEGRKLYWACHACEETAICVQGMFDGRSREMKNLKKEREGIDSEWEVDGAMSALVRTGVLGEASEKPAKKAPAARPSTAPSRGVPPRNSIKRPASSRLRAEHGTPFKATRTSTPMKSAKDASSTKKRLPPSSSSKQLSTPTMKPGTSPRKFSESKAANRLSSAKRLPSRPSSVTDKRAKDATPSGASVNTMRSSGGKENTVAMRTPAKSVGFNVNNLNPASPMVGTPVVNLLARASPLSAERIQNTEDVLGVIIDMLSDKISPHEQSLGIKALALFAKENPNDPSWEEKFPEVLACLLEHIKDMPAEDFSGPVDFIRSPAKNLSSCHQMQHLFIQALRNLLQFVPGYVKPDQIHGIICCMIECTKDAPFDVVHTAERALSNLVDAADAETCETCFENLLQFTSVDIDLNDKQNPPALLSTLRTMMQLIDRISVDSLKKALPSLLPLFRTALCHKSMDMRKATVFLLVEMHFVLGDELGLNDLTDSQQRLLNVYIEKHPKNTRMVEAAS